MKIDYRQIIIIGGILLFFELLSLGFKKCSTESSGGTSNNSRSMFPILLNDSTRFLLIGDWKCEEIFFDDKELKHETSVLRYQEDGSVKYGFLSSESSRKYDSVKPYGAWCDGKWRIENENIIIEWPKTDFSEPDIQKNIIIFYNEDEINEISAKDKKKTKWLRINETKHLYNINDESK